MAFASFQAEYANHQVTISHILEQLSEQLGSKVRPIHEKVEGGIYIHVIKAIGINGDGQDDENSINLSQALFESPTMDNMEGCTIQAKHQQGYYQNLEWEIRFAESTLQSNGIKVQRNIVLFAEVDW